MSHPSNIIIPPGNLLLNQNLDANWSSSNGSATGKVGKAPDGTYTSGLIIEDTSLNGHGVTQTITKASSALPYTLTYYAKRYLGTRGIGSFIFGTGFASGTDTYFKIDPIATALAATGFGTFSAYTSVVTKLWNGWYLFKHNFTSDATANLIVYVTLDDGSGGANYTGDGVSGNLYWGVCLRQGTF